MNVQIDKNSSHAKIFNTNLIRLLEQTYDVLLSNNQNDSDIADFKMLKEKLSILCKINAKIASNIYLKMVEDKIEPLMKHDVTYFQTMDFCGLCDNKIQEQYSVGNRLDTYYNLIGKLIMLLSTDHKDNLNLHESLFKYFEVLLCYAIKTHKRADLLEIMNKYREHPLTLD